ncbi:hypothetical protein F5878DRAFT_431069 [Lentinula raphanica]|uniref:Uncharacterized protein n=1 Tax=Lentinula raphanica TaxID=153919 RepID=A0AA38PFV2_9AGAR|nr:hypothetical protein F5880DRAFT_946437 [Lentinula raphanica]KAJ3841976.1 hypothetical protein F5878DRAFT_431069 [Lentinula raphanica]
MYVLKVRTIFDQTHTSALSTLLVIESALLVIEDSYTTFKFYLLVIVIFTLLVKDYSYYTKSLLVIVIFRSLLVKAHKFPTFLTSNTKTSFIMLFYPPNRRGSSIGSIIFLAMIIALVADMSCSARPTDVSVTVTVKKRFFKDP